MRKISCLIAILVLISSTSVFGGNIASQIPYAKATTLAPAKYTFRFSLWDVASEGREETNRVWWEEKNMTLPTSKKITTTLGSVTNVSKRSGPLGDVDFSVQYWVQVEKLESDGVTYTPIGAKTKFTVVPYAMWSAQGGDDKSVVAGNGLVSSVDANGDLEITAIGNMLASPSVQAAGFGTGARVGRRGLPQDLGHPRPRRSRRARSAALVPAHGRPSALRRRLDLFRRPGGGGHHAGVGRRRRHAEEGLVGPDALFLPGGCRMGPADAAPRRGGSGYPPR